MTLLAGWRPGPTGRIRLIGAAVLAAMVMLTWIGAPWTERQQAAWFDLHQVLYPRTPSAAPITVIAIDQASLRELGQWPWPRTQLARLIQIVGDAGAAAIGVDILMPEADSLSPEQLAAQEAIQDPVFVDMLRRLPSHDSQLAKAIAAAPVVLAVAGAFERTRTPLRVAPVLVQAAHGDAPPREPAVLRYPYALTNIAELDAAAHGWGLISVAPSRGIIRRVPLVAGIDRTLVPTLAVEMLRVAQHAGAARLTVAGHAVRRVSVGSLAFPTERDASVRPYFAPHDATRFIPAVNVLKDRVAPGRFAGQLVLIGATGIALQEEEDTPSGERMSAIEIHAQLLDNLVGGTLLRRPMWASAVEAAVLAGLGALLLWTTPRRSPLNAALAALACIAVGLGLGFAAFAQAHLLIDAMTPALDLLLLFFLLLGMTLTEVLRQRRLLHRQVQGQRELGARLAGELQAAQRVQAATLPSANVLAADRRIELHAVLEAAREVGGDLYDFYMLDERRLFLLVGDVAGKGLSASIFMAVSKALYKSAMLRSPDADIGVIMTAANAEVSRENTQMLFVTAFAAILDLDSGELEYCNAGHENPYRLHRGRLLRIADGDGPPLCAVADFGYRGARCRLTPGELLCVMTDGVTEAQSSAGELFGHARVEEVLVRAMQGNADPRELVQSLRERVQAFAAGAEPADDLTVLALRWNGPAEVAGGPA